MWPMCPPATFFATTLCRPRPVQAPLLCSPPSGHAALLLLEFGAAACGRLVASGWCGFVASVPADCRAEAGTRGAAGEGRAALLPQGLEFWRTASRDGGRGPWLACAGGQLGWPRPDAPGSQVCPRVWAPRVPGPGWAGLSAAESSSSGREKTSGGMSASSALAASVAADRSGPTLEVSCSGGGGAEGQTGIVGVESRVGGFSFLLTFQQKSGSPGLSPQGRVAVRASVL